MEEKINLVKNFIISINPVRYNILGGSKTIGIDITVKIKGKVSTNTIVFFVRDINFKEIEFICKINKKVDDLVIALYNFIKENNREIKDYIECV